MMLAFVGLTMTLAHAQSETGTITGHVRLATKVRAPLPASVYSSRSIGRHDAPSTPEIQNVVVYLKDAVFRGTLPVAKVELHQQNESFVPHVLAITKGSTVEFPNDDPFFHNVFSLSSASKFNLGRYPRGQTRPWKFTRPGLVKVFCDIHSHMSASILVLDHPYFAIPGTDGSFELADVPPGQYTLIGWHERVGERAAPLRVQAGQTTAIDITVPIEDAR
jgi:plastocyanin